MPALSRARRFGLAYIVLLLASTAVRLLWPADNVPADDQRTVQVVDGGTDVRVAYRDIGPRDGTPVLLLHGTPVAGIAVMPMARELDDRWRVIVPDMPGFGGSSLQVDDYSFAAHARVTTAFLDRLGVDSAHLVAYSQGGGVALSMAQHTPQRVRSIALVSSIGVQELELLGDYRLNRALYVAQLWLLRGVEWLVPHFGYLDTAVLNVAYARNVYDSDQRPLRGILEALSVPTVVIHGRDDKLVPLAAAREHHRIVPHSTLELFDGGHMLVFTEPDGMGGAVRAFLDDVDAGTAATLADATDERLRAAAVPFDWRQVPAFEGLTLAIILLLLALATYVSEDLACITAGLLVARGMLEFFPATAACLVGIYTGDLLLYVAGRTMGAPAVARAPLKWFVDVGKLDRSRQWFNQRGPIVIFLSRFIPGTRLPTYLAAGVLRMSLARFSFYFLLAAIVWTPLLVGGAYLLGAGALQFLAAYQRYSIPIVLGLIALLWLTVKIVVPLFSFRGRRLLLSAWRRKTRWEFWPMWAFYPPLLVYVLYLGLRYRGFTLFTASNPAMPASGFVGESKSAILEGLSGAGERIAQFAVLEPGSATERKAQVHAFMEARDLGFPVVLKPDVGERGNGVLIAHNDDAVAAYLASEQGPVIVQEFAPGHEFGVFYYRIPGESTGRIFAVTDKRPPVVTGDGERTLEELILCDDRAVCMAETFMDRHAASLFDVPEAGERVPLVDIGTHCKGCLFLDGNWVISPALEAEIDRVSKTFDGFFFGRYDIRTTDVEAFARGENYKVVELNGVTSEATNIYDPRNSLLKAYRVLFRQWELAFRIGAANRALGQRPVSVADLFRMVAAARQA